MISGTYRGKLPKRWQITGEPPRDSSGQRRKQMVECKVLSCPKNIPVARILINDRLNNLTADQWYEADASRKQKLQREVEDLSVQHEMPSAYTSMVAYEENDT
eukprot:UN19640